jgi:hypothetical protein
MTVPPTALRSSQALRRMIYRMIKDPQAIRDFDPRRLSRLFRPIVNDMRDGAREMVPAKDALWLQRSLPDDA